jgi:FlaA1/EpsC-like NDP-sugar epimerase
VARSVQFLIGISFVHALGLAIWRPKEIPLSFVVEGPALFLSAFLATRFVAARFLGIADRKNSQFNNFAAKAIIYGAGEAGRELAMGLTHSSNFKVVAFIDEDPGLKGAVIQGLSVHAPTALKELIGSRQISHVLLAMPSISRSRRSEVVKGLADLGVKVMTLPSLSDLAHGRVSVRDLRDIDIEDLLARETTKPNEILLNKDTRGKVVLVTGAGGSIGSEICRQVIQRNPAKLVLLDVSEPALYFIDAELREAYPEANVAAVLCSVQDASQLNRVMALHRPDTVYHLSLIHI